MPGKKVGQTTDAVEILRRRFVQGDAASEALLEEILRRGRGRSDDLPAAERGEAHPAGAGGASRHHRLGDQPSRGL